MKKIRDWLGGIVLLTVLVCLFVPSVLATPPAPVDIESFLLVMWLLHRLRL